MQAVQGRQRMLLGSRSMVDMAEQAGGKVAVFASSMLKVQERFHTGHGDQEGDARAAVS